MMRITVFLLLFLLCLLLANHGLAFTVVKHTATTQFDLYKPRRSNCNIHQGYHYHDVNEKNGHKWCHDVPFRHTFSELRMLPESIQSGSSVLQAVEVFDGSTILDPVVVSTVFWSSLKAKILSVLVGQLIATAAVGFLTFIFSSQLVAFGNFVSQEFFKKESVGAGVVQRAEFDGRVVTPSPKIIPDIGKLMLCLLIDIVGTSSEFIPLVGEITDIAYAPLAAFALRYLFQGSNVIFALEFVEEFLPFTDVLPLATLCWILETYFGDSDIAKLLQIGLYSNASQKMTNNLEAQSQNRRKDDNIIDAEVKVLRDES